VVGAYLREIGRTPLLHPEEEVALARRVARGDTEAAQVLAQANLRLVVTIAGRYGHCGLPLEDLIAEGNLGLLAAVQKYEWQRGCRFSTYAVWWIRQAITRAIANQGHTIRVPTHLAEALARHARAVDQLATALGRPPSAEELAALPAPDPAYSSAAASAVQTPLPLDMAVGESGAEHLADVLADESAVTPEDEAVGRLTREEACRVLHEVLTERECLVVMLRCGFEGGVPESLPMIGRRLSVGRERVRQIEDTALRKLRQRAVVARLGAPRPPCVA
jgi:RNA polymerase primary sigma factor